MKKWQKNVEEYFEIHYPGVTVRWDGDDPTFSVPDELFTQVENIKEAAIALWDAMGDELQLESVREVPA